MLASCLQMSEAGLGTAIDWHNNRRLHTACHDLTPVEYEQVFYGQHPAQQTVGVSQP